jgi:hypothetical protein
MKYKEAILKVIDQALLDLLYPKEGKVINTPRQLEKVKELVQLFFEEIEDYKRLYLYNAKNYDSPSLKFDRRLNIERAITLKVKSEMCNDLLELELDSRNQL